MNPLALHEAAHCLTAWLLDVRVDSVTVGEDAGVCEFARLSPWGSDMILIGMAGATAEELFAGRQFSDALSLADMRLIELGEARYGQQLGVSVTASMRRAWRDQTLNMLAAHERGLRQLAAELSDRGGFDRRTLASYLNDRQCAPDLKRFRSLYPIARILPGGSIVGGASGRRHDPVAHPRRPTSARVW